MANVVLGEYGLTEGTNFLYDLLYSVIRSNGVENVTATTAETFYAHEYTDEEPWEATFEVKFSGIGLDATSGKVTGFDVLIDGRNNFSVTGLDVDFASLTNAADEQHAGDLQAVFQGVDWTADFSGSKVSTLVFGTGGDDNFVLTNKNDLLFIDGGNDLISMGRGDDEVILGSFGDAVISTGSSIIEGGNGLDYVFLTYGDDEFFTKGQTINMAKIQLSIDDQDVVLKGFEGIVATRFADNIKGTNRDEVIEGFNGNNIIQGGGGADTLTSGGGKDLFIYKKVTDSSFGADHDTINTFQHGRDKIDLSKIDPDNKSGDFKFVGEGLLKNAGDIRFKQFDDPMNDDPFSDYTVITAQIDGKGGPDFEIHLLGLIDLTKSDFIL